MMACYIFDIDGTLANCSQRLHFILPPEEDLTGNIDLDKIAPDWESFYKDCINDKPILDNIHVVHRLVATGAEVYFVTGRPEKYREQTFEWLDKYIPGIEPQDLYMRKDGDHRPDTEVKKEIYKNFLCGKNICGIFEDRDSCVKMWRSFGLTCYQVADGNY